MNFSLNRRSFLFGASALSLSGCMSPSASASSASRLVFGVLSDIHLTDPQSADVFEKTLRYFRTRRVDAVVIAGDMADHGLLPQLQAVADTWYRVFPDDCGEDGGKVEKIFVYGNHDIEGLNYRDAAMKKAFAAMNLTEEQAKELTLKKVGYAQAWETCFHEPYAPFYHKRVKGYDFIGAHWQTWHGQDGLEEWFARHVSEINTHKPFFFVQHQHPFGTVYGSDSWGDDAGQSTRMLAPYPYAVAFSGHSHRSLTDDRSYWQGEFTSIGTSTLSYVCLPTGRANQPNYRTNLDARQGQVVTVFDDRLEVERFDFIADEALAAPKVLPMPARCGSFSVRACQPSNSPKFPPAFKASVARRGKGVEIRFPTATGNPEALPYDYLVTFDAEGADGKRVGVKRTLYHPDFVFSNRRSMAPRELTCTVPLSEFRTATLAKLRAVVRVRNCFGRTCDESWGEWVTL